MLGNIERKGRALFVSGYVYAVVLALFAIATRFEVAAALLVVASVTDTFWTTMRRATHAVGAIEGSTRFSNSSGNSRRSRGQSKSGSAMYWTACWCRVGTVDRKLKGRSRLRNLRSESVGSVRRP